MGRLKCGLYRTGIALSGREEAVAAERLIYFHDHSTEGPPLVLLPTENAANRWRFGERGYLVQGEHAEAFLAALEALAPEGCYVVTREIAVGEGRVLGRRTLVQLGYNRAGEVILFPAQALANGWTFPERGFRFRDRSVMAALRDAGFDAPRGVEGGGGEWLH